MCTSLPALIFDVFGQLLSIFPAKLRLLGTACIVIPGENNVFSKLWLLGAPATQYLPPLLFGLLASSAIFCVVFVSLQPRLRHNLSVELTRYSKRHRDSELL